MTTIMLESRKIDANQMPGGKVEEEEIGDDNSTIVDGSTVTKTSTATLRAQQMGRETFFKYGLAGFT